MGNALAQLIINRLMVQHRIEALRRNLKAANTRQAALIICRIQRLEASCHSLKTT